MIATDGGWTPTPTRGSRRSPPGARRCWTRPRPTPPAPGPRFPPGWPTSSRSGTLGDPRGRPRGCGGPALELAGRAPVRPRHRGRHPVRGCLRPLAARRPRPRRAAPRHPGRGGGLAPDIAAREVQAGGLAALGPELALFATELHARGLDPSAHRPSGTCQDYVQWLRACPGQGWDVALAVLHGVEHAYLHAWTTVRERSTGHRYAAFLHNWSSPEFAARVGALAGLLGEQPPPPPRSPPTGRWPSSSTPSGARCTPAERGADQPLVPTRAPALTTPPRRHRATGGHRHDLQPQCTPHVDELRRPDSATSGRKMRDTLGVRPSERSRRTSLWRAWWEDPHPAGRSPPIVIFVAHGRLHRANTAVGGDCRLFILDRRQRRRT